MNAEDTAGSDVPGEMPDIVADAIGGNIRPPDEDREAVIRYRDDEREPSLLQALDERSDRGDDVSHEAARVIRKLLERQVHVDDRRELAEIVNELDSIRSIAGKASQLLTSLNRRA